jgi:arsenate reductase
MTENRPEEADTMDRKPVVLFVCTHNSARSQMAEGWLRHLAGDRFDVRSAGVEPGTLNPLSVRAMEEVGVDLSGHRAKGIDEYLGRLAVWHLVVVCDKADQSCPRVWHGMRERHFWPFEDPAAATGAEDDRLAAFRRVRDAIGEKLRTWIVELDRRAEHAGAEPGC